MADKYIKRSEGFTLVELSIVIIIIGFLIAGISAGQSLIKQAALTSTINDYGSYVTAVRSFEARYGYLPGDFPNASSYWATAVNGNGDGIIEPYLNAVQLAENFNAWNQLAFAGIIPGNYPPGAIAAAIGVTSPTSKLSTATGFDFDYFTVFGRTGGAMVLASVPWVTGALNGGGMTPADGAAMDQKMDDGNPGTGRMFIERGAEYTNDATKCVDQPESAALGTPVNFLFNDTSVSCRSWFFFDLDN